MSVHQCPQNKNDWDTASQRLQCVDPNSYHCLQTEDGGETEQCLGKVWIQEGMCPEYNSKVGKIDVFSCSHSLSCPTEIYWSNEVYQYPICSELTSSTTTRNPLQEDDNSPIDKDQFTSVYIIISISIATVIFISLLIGIICFIHKRKSGNRQTIIDTPNAHQLTTDCPLLEVAPNENLSPRRHYTVARNDATTSVDPSFSDIEDLEMYGVLIFIYDDSIGIGPRIKIIEECGKFGKSKYVSPLDQWEPEEDVSLYLIRQPIGDLSSLMEFLCDNGDNLYQRVKSKEMYFVLTFERFVWQRNQIRFLKYDFFYNAKTRTI